MSKTKISKNLLIARKMPPLYHSIPGKAFDIKNSRVLWWLTKQPEILNYIWNNLKNSGLIVYNKETGKWHGIDFKEDDED